MKNEIQTLCTEYVDLLSSVEIESMSFEIDMSKLTKPLCLKNENIIHDLYFKDIFNRIMERNSFPAVYIWTIKYPNHITSKEIIEMVSSIEHTPAYYKRNDIDVVNSTLYVGKVKSNFYGRLIQHLGVHKNETSHGLQFSKWANKEVNPRLKEDFIVNLDVYFILEQKLSNFVELIETKIADIHKPIIGKH